MTKRNFLASALVILALCLSILLPTIILKGIDRPSISGDTDNLFSLARIFGIAALASLFLANAFAAYAAFDKDLAWAIAVLFVPIALPAFVILHPHLAKPALPFLALSMVLSALYYIML